jgi:hypothetical protein
MKISLGHDSRRFLLPEYPGISSCFRDVIIDDIRVRFASANYRSPGSDCPLHAVMFWLPLLVLRFSQGEWNGKDERRTHS